MSWTGSRFVEHETAYVTPSDVYVEPLFCGHVGKLEVEVACTEETVIEAFETVVCDIDIGVVAGEEVELPVGDGMGGIT